MSDDSDYLSTLTHSQMKGLRISGEILFLIENLLDIVATPPELFAIDPRVIRAQAVLAKLLLEVQ